jgi:hypothetical protein
MNVLIPPCNPNKKHPTTLLHQPPQPFILPPFSPQPNKGKTYALDGNPRSNPHRRRIHHRRHQRPLRPRISPLPSGQPQYLFVGGIALKVTCGLALLFNIFVPFAAFVLAIFTLIANVIFNDFWRVTGPERKSTFLHFLINIAVIGGLLVLAGT